MKRHLAVMAIAAVLAFSLLVPARTTTQPSSNVTQEPGASSDAEQAMFTKGQKLYLQGNYTQAAEVLDKFLQSYPNSIITDLTLLWLGRSYYQLGRFTEAEQVGKRLRAIKDTPFADIYGSELEKARRDAALQQSSSRVAEKVVSHPPQQHTSSAVASSASRNRYAKASGIAQPPAAAGVKLDAVKSAARKPTTASQANLAGRSNREVTRQTPGSGKAKRQAPANNTTAKVSGASSRRNASAANNVLRRSNKASQPSRHAVLSATQHRATQNQQRVAAKRKASSPSRVLRADATSHARPSGRVSIAKPTPRQSPAVTNQLRSQNKSPRTTTATPSDRPTISEDASFKQSEEMRIPPALSTDSSTPAVLSKRAATGGLYSMINASVGTAPAGTVPQTLVDVMTKRINAKPGEIVYLPFLVRNLGSTRPTYELRVTAPGAPEARVYVDSNGDGIHQSDELRVTGSPVVELTNSGLPLLLEITVPRDAFEGQQYSYTVTVLLFGKGEVVATATSTLTVSSIRARLLPPNIAGDKAALAR